MLTVASVALIGNPTTVTDVQIVETPLTKATESAPVDACSNLLQALLYFCCLTFSLYFSLRIRYVLIVFSNHLNVKTFLIHQWRSRQLRIKIFGHIYVYSI